MEHSFTMWVVFVVVVAALLILDLGVLHRRQREISVKESLLLSGFYITMSLLFGVWVWSQLGPERGSEYFTGYLIEKSLSVDNLFVMSLIFSYFHIPRELQHRVLFWGIVGVIVLRGVMIGVGAALVERFEWVLYIFAAFLMFTGFKMLFSKDSAPDISENRLLLFLKTRFRFTEELDGKKFAVMRPDKDGRMVRFYTPLMLALIIIETADVLFAVDSIPAIFAITTEPYIIYSSNIFAVMGLRALFFALSASLERFHYLKYALALILVFIGGKVFLADMLGLEKIPAMFSLGVTIGLLASGIVISLAKTKK